MRAGVALGEKKEKAKGDPANGRVMRPLSSELASDQKFVFVL